MPFGAYDAFCFYVLISPLADDHHDDDRSHGKNNSDNADPNGGISVRKGRGVELALVPNGMHTATLLPNTPYRVGTIPFSFADVTSAFTISSLLIIRSFPSVFSPQAKPMLAAYAILPQGKERRKNFGGLTFFSSNPQKFLHRFVFYDIL